MIISLIEANAYFTSRLYTDVWDAASDIDKTKALTMASTIVDKFAYIGVKTSEGQAHEFPRSGILGLSSTAIPVQISIAICEIAALLLDGFDIEKEINNLRVTSHAIAGVRTTYDSDIIPEHLQVGVPSALAWSLMKQFILQRQGIFLHRVN